MHYTVLVNISTHVAQSREFLLVRLLWAAGRLVHHAVNKFLFKTLPIFTLITRVFQIR